mgnify:CR=1 FL=1
MDQLYPGTAFSMVKVLEKAGCKVSYNTNQTCCGQPAYNAGFWGEAKEVCTKFINDFRGNDYIVAPSASCAGFVKNYYHKLFENSSLHHDVKKLSEQVYEFSSFMVQVLKVEDVGAVLNGKATYHDSCAALRECHIKQEPRILLSNVRDLQLLEMDDVETCCGFGGTFAVRHPTISAAMVADKTRAIKACGAPNLVSADCGCLMNINGALQKQGERLQGEHIASFVWRRIGGEA